MKQYLAVTLIVLLGIAASVGPAGAQVPTFPLPLMVWWAQHCEGTPGTAPDCVLIVPSPTNPDCATFLQMAQKEWKYKIRGMKVTRTQPVPPLQVPGSDANITYTLDKQVNELRGVMRVMCTPPPSFS